MEASGGQKKSHILMRSPGEGDPHPKATHLVTEMCPRVPEPQAGKTRVLHGMVWITQPPRTGVWTQ